MERPVGQFVGHRIHSDRIEIQNARHPAIRMHAKIFRMPIAVQDLLGMIHDATFSTLDLGESRQFFKLLEPCSAGRGTFNGVPEQGREFHFRISARVIRSGVMSSCSVEHGQSDSGGVSIAASPLGTLPIYPRLQLPDKIGLFDVPCAVGLRPKFGNWDLGVQTHGHDGSHELQPVG